MRTHRNICMSISQNILHYIYIYLCVWGGATPVPKGYNQNSSVVRLSFNSLLAAGGDKSRCMAVANEAPCSRLGYGMIWSPDQLHVPAVFFVISFRFTERLFFSSVCTQQNPFFAVLFEQSFIIAVFICLLKKALKLEYPDPLIGNKKWLIDDKTVCQVCPSAQDSVMVQSWSGKKILKDCRRVNFLHLNGLRPCLFPWSEKKQGNTPGSFLIMIISICILWNHDMIWETNFSNCSSTWVIREIFSWRSKISSCMFLPCQEVEKSLNWSCTMNLS